MPATITGCTLLGEPPSPEDPNTYLVDLGYNALTTADAGVRTFLDGKDPDWATTQTVAPTGLAAEPAIAGATLTWTPTTYTADAGYYEVGVATTPSGGYTVAVTTTNKADDGAAVDGLEPGLPHYLAVRTVTLPHGTQQNTVASPWSAGVQCVPEVFPPSGVTISGPAEGEVGVAYAFTAEVAPASTTPSVTYTWSPEPQAGQGSATATYSWAEAGRQTVGLTVANAAGRASTTHTIALVPPTWTVWLPALRR